MKKFLTIFFLGLLILSGCSQEKTEKTTDKLMVYTTVYPLAYFTEQIGGKYVDVHSVYPTGGDEHTFEPTSKDFIRFAEADLFFYVGMGLEGFMSKAEESLTKENVELIAVGDAIGAKGNPHIWLDSIQSTLMVEKIAQSLSEKMPEQARVFAENKASLQKRLASLNQQYRSALKDLHGREFLVSHDAYSYWETSYDIKQLHVMGKSTSDEPSPKDLAALVALAKEHNLRYVLVEQNVTNKVITTIEKELGAKPLPLHNLAVLTEKDIAEKADYFSLAERNLESLVKALRNE